MGFMGKQAPIEEVDVSSPGLESVWAGEGDKEVIMHTAPPTQPPPPPPVNKPKRICGMKRFVFWILLVGALVIIIGLSIGLGVGLTVGHSTESTSSGLSSDYYIGGALNPSYYSTKGAFNGSGLALASQSFGSGEYGELVLYFQHYTGTIRWQRLTPVGWTGGSESEIVASDAKNGTTLSAVAYSLNGTSVVRTSHPDYGSDWLNTGSGISFILTRATACGKRPTATPRTYGKKGR